MHTSGPWRFAEAKSGQWFIYATGSEQPIVPNVRVTKGRLKNQEAMDNAKLMALSPDLLSALRLLVADVEQYEAWERPCHALDVAKSVLKRCV